MLQDPTERRCTQQSGSEKQWREGWVPGEGCCSSMGMSFSYTRCIYPRALPLNIVPIASNTGLCT